MVAITDERLLEVLGNNDKAASFKLNKKKADQDQWSLLNALKIPSSFNLLPVLYLWMYWYASIFSYFTALQHDL